MNVCGLIVPILHNCTRETKVWPRGIYKNIKYIFHREDKEFFEYVNWHKDIPINATDGWLTAELLNNDAIEQRGVVQWVQNVTINSYGSFSYGDELLHVRTGCYWTWYDLKVGKVFATVDSIILLGHWFVSFNYGHWFNDVLMPLMLIPENIQERCYIVNNGLPNVSTESLLVLGFRDEQIIHVYEAEWIFANNVYIVNHPSPYLAHFSLCTTKLRAKFWAAYDLDKIKATRYVFCNRKEGTWRSINNMDEIFNATKVAFNSYPWEKMKDYHSNLSETAKAWTSIRFIFLPTGSNAIKVLFMKNYTTMCVGQADRVDHSIMKDIASCNVFSRWFRMYGVYHYNTNPIILNVSFVLENIKFALYVDKYKKWPQLEI